MADEIDWEIKWSKGVFFAAILVLPNLFPLVQLFLTKGYLFYQNAFDEYSYLSYEAASSEMGFLKFSNYLVKWPHEWNLSSGHINFIFDLVCPGLIAFFIFKIILLLEFDRKKSLLAAVLIVMIPVVVGGSNPVYSKIFYSLLESGGTHWWVLPEAFFPPFYRTPEPQFSYLLLVVAIYHAVKRKTFIPLYCVVPFLYGFVRVPCLFVIFSCHLSAINEKTGFIRTRYANWLIGLISYLLVSIMVGLYYEFALKGTLTAEFLPATRLPILSGTFVVCLLIWWFLPRSSKERNPGFYAFVVAAPLVAVNTQMISGFIAQPINFEQGFGVVCISFLATVFILSLKFERQKWLLPVMGVFGILLSAVYSIQVFRINSNPTLLEQPSQKLIAALREDSYNVVFEDSALASTMSMVLPRQTYTALAISQSYGFAASNYFDRYLCVKEKIKREAFGKYKNSLASLDKGYTHLHSDFVFIHLNRRKDFRVFFDVNKKPENCSPKKLYFYPGDG